MAESALNGFKLFYEDLEPTGILAILNSKRGKSNG